MKEFGDFNYCVWIYDCWNENLCSSQCHAIMEMEMKKFNNNKF